MSTNKVYGDAPNKIKMVELDSRWDYMEDVYKNGISESFTIDQSKHSLFGSSKVSADISVQEYGRYFGMPTTVLRGGCLTGPSHSGVELHGFLSYLIKCNLRSDKYTVFGYKAKQVRDNIHSYDLLNMFWHYHQNPKPGEVYNAGGGRENSVSILEAIEKINELRINDGLDPWDNYIISDQARIGDHIWYISDLTKFKNDYPEWPGITISLNETIKQMYLAEKMYKDEK
jgi:CDP-paratose 2-epimerase